MASQDIFFNHFEVYPASKGDVGHGLVSLSRVQNQVFKFFIDSWKQFKINYFLPKPLSHLAHEESCIVYPIFDGRLGYIEQRWRLWSSKHFFECDKSYWIPYDALNDANKDMKEIMILFSNGLIPCKEVAKTGSMEKCNMKKFVFLFKSLKLLKFRKINYYRILLNPSQLETFLNLEK